MNSASREFSGSPRKASAAWCAAFRPPTPPLFFGSKTRDAPYSTRRPTIAKARSAPALRASERTRLRPRGVAAAGTSTSSIGVIGAAAVSDAMRFSVSRFSSIVFLVQSYLTAGLPFPVGGDLGRPSSSGYLT